MEKSLQDYKNYAFAEGPLKVVKTQVMHGANFFSAGPIVLIRLNLDQYNEVFTNTISGFPEKLKNALPSLIHHHCSLGHEGGFLLRVNEGTLLGHVIEHVAIEFQTLAGMDVGYGKTRSTLEEGIYNIIFRFFDEIAGTYAGKAAVNLINAILTNKEFNCQEIVDDLIDIREKRLLGPSTQAIVDEAEKRKIPWLRLDTYNLVQLGTGKYRKHIRATITSDTNLIAVETADNKYLTSLMLKDAGIPVAETIRADNIKEVFAFYNHIQKPIVIKPSEGYLGKRLAINLNTEEEITKAFALAKEFDEKILVQPHIQGCSYRLLVINFKFVAATELLPPFIKGDGALSIQKLINKLNAEPIRQKGDKGKLSKIEIDEITAKLISDREYNFDSILPKGEILFLKNSGNMKLGGSAKDVSKLVHPFNILLAERAAKVIGLNVAGVDFIAPDIALPINENGGVIIEVNAAPDFRMHMNPTIGESRNVAANLVEMLFPKNTLSRVPVFSVTGTAGKTIAVTLLNYCLQQEGYTTGMANSDGLYIDGKCLMAGNMTYSESASLVLKDPTIDCAVLETSREGILRSGLGYKFADFGIVLNLHEDLLGIDDMEYIEDVAYTKSVVAEEVYDEGYSILNADIDHVLEIKSRLYSKLCLFSKDPQNKNVAAHIVKGGMAVTCDDDAIYVHNKTKSEKIIELAKIPLTFGNKAKFLYDEILAVAAALAASGIASEKISLHLQSFLPNQEMLPGRMNMMDVKNFKVLIDNAHNTANFVGLKNFLTAFPGKKLGVIHAAGDRSDDEIIILGSIAAQTYDEIFIYEDNNKHERAKGEVTALLKKGAISTGFSEQGISIFSDSVDALEEALKRGNKDLMITILTSNNKKTLSCIAKLQCM
jgi:cyanophycin synthetase